MKRFILISLSFTLFFLMAFCLFGCGDSEVESNNIINDNSMNNSSEEVVFYDDIKLNATLLYPGENEIWSYNVYSDSTGIYDKFIEITRCNKIHATNVVPEYIDDIPVIALGEYAFSNNSGRNKMIVLKIPDSVIYIGDKCCYYCECLSIVTLSKNLVEVGEGAFYYAPIKNLELPSTLRVIKDEAFCYPDTDCEIAELVIPESVTYIGKNAANVGEVYIMNPNVKINGDAFPINRKVHGYIGSTAASYAAEWDYTFVPMK